MEKGLARDLHEEREKRRGEGRGKNLEGTKSAIS